MCEMLGTTPVEEEIPIEYDDLPIEVQEVLGVYKLLKDDFEYVNGNYLGKSLVGIKDIFDLCNIPESQRLFTLELIFLLDSLRAEEYARQKPTSK